METHIPYAATSSNLLASLNSPAFIQNEQCDVAKIVSVRSLNHNFMSKFATNPSVSHNVQVTSDGSAAPEFSANHKAVKISHQWKASLITERLLPKYSPDLEFVRKTELHTCPACADQFYFKSSLETHKARLSMNISYFCSNCKATFIFYNKCTLIIHVKGHQSDASKATQINIRNVTITALTDKQLDQVPDIMVKINDVSMVDGISSISCYGCGMMFASFKNLSIHLGKDDKICSFAYQCKVCFIYVPRKCSLALHNRLHALCKIAPFLCPECGRSFTTNVNRDIHVRFTCLHYCRIPTFKCPCCKGVVFEKDYFLAMHICNNHMVTYYKCHTCPLAFKTQETYQGHATAVHGPIKVTKIFRCPLCETVFNNPSMIREHINTHVETIKKNTHFAFKCTICKKFSDNRMSLMNHMDRVHNTRPTDHYCQSCNIGCNSLQQLSQHVCSAASNAMRPIVQNSFTKYSTSNKMIASKVEVSPFDEKKILTGIKNHTSPVDLHEKPTCMDKYVPIAPKLREIETVSFLLNDQTKQTSKSKKKKNKKKLKKELKKFSSKTCPVCQLGFMNIDELMVHLEGHEQSGLFACTNCLDKTFLSLEEVKKHESTCTLYKPGSSKLAQYKCSDCSSAFLRSDELEEHKKNRHSIAKQFPCHLCGLTYDSEQKLQDHVRSSHDAQPNFYSCEVCKNKKHPRTFTIKSMLVRHLINKHRLARGQLDSYFSNKMDMDSTKVPQNNSDPSPKRSNSDSMLNNSPIKRLKLAGDRHFLCAKCTFLSEDYNMFKSHISQHNVENSIQCFDCGLCFAAFPSLRKHRIIVHKSEDVSEYTIPEDDVTDDDSDIIRPISTYVHTPPKKPASPPGTDVDSMSSSQKSTTNDLECNVCYREFEDITALKKHMRNHGMAFIRSKRFKSVTDHDVKVEEDKKNDND